MKKNKISRVQFVMKIRNYLESVGYDPIGAADLIREIVEDAEFAAWGMARDKKIPLSIAYTMIDITNLEQYYDR